MPGLARAVAIYGQTDWTGLDNQQDNNTTTTPSPLRRAVAQLLLVNRAGRELLHLSMRFLNPSTERDGSS